MKFKVLFLSIMVIVALVGCSQEKEVIKNDKNTKNSVENVKNTNQKPPQLKIIVNEEEYSTALSGYTWSYFDKEDGMTSVEVESVPPSELIGKQKRRIVNSDASIKLEFETEPDSYQVNIWDSANNVKGPFEDVIVDGKTGEMVYEIVASWDQGTAHYFFSLTIE